MRTNEDLHQNQNAHSEHSSNAGSPAGQTRRQFLSRSALGLPPARQRVAQLLLREPQRKLTP